MSDPKEQEIQQELFEEFSKESKRAERIPPLARAQKPILFSTTIEHVLLGGILFVLALCFVFFLGVLRGKSLTPLAPIAPTSRAVPQAPVLPQPQKAKAFVASPTVSNTPDANKVVSMQISKPMVALPSHSSVTAMSQNNAAKPYTIQLVTHKKKETADSEVASLKRNNFYSFIITSGEYYLVCVGQYASKEEAKKDLRFFGGKFKDCFLRRR